MKFQILMAAMALSLCNGQPVKREPREFIRQHGSPSVRRYPVYPDRLKSIDKSAATNELDKGAEPTPKSVVDLLGTNRMTAQTEKMRTEEPTETSTSPWSSPEPSEPLTTTTTTTTPTTTTTQSSSTTSSSTTSSSTTFSTFSETAPDFSGPSSTLGGGFSFTPKPSTLFDTNEDLPFVFPSEDDLPGPLNFSSSSEREPVFPSSFGEVTEGVEISTDMAMTTDVPNDLITEEERFVSPTSYPEVVEEEEEVEVEGELANNFTDSPLLGQTPTESAWDPLTEEIYTTEDIALF